MAPAELEDTLRQLEGRDADRDHDPIIVHCQIIDMKPSESESL